MRVRVCVTFRIYCFNGNFRLYIFLFFFITGDTTFYEMRNIDCLNIFDLITVIYRISVIDTRKIVKGIVEFIFYLVS